MNQVRKPTVAGMFYDADEHMLYDQIQSCFVSDHGPGSVSIPTPDSPSLKGVIVPHAGYPYSGGIAAFAYNAIIEAGLADVYIIIGPNHSGFGSGVAMSSKGYWETPLGKTPVDESLVQALSDSIIDPDNTTMNHQENSIEVQVPFLQYISKEKPFSIVPIAMLMQDKKTAEDVGGHIASAIQKDDRSIVFIASTDFSHEGIAYGKIPPDNMPVQDYVSRQDAYALDHIKKMDPEGLFDTVEKHQVSMCGTGPVAAVLNAAKKLNGSSVELLKYGRSYDVHPDSNACVGYASVALY